MAIKKLTCRTSWYTEDEPCPRASKQSMPRHLCFQTFPLKNHEIATLKGVQNSGEVQAALAKAKHKVHECLCGATCDVGSEGYYNL